MYCRYVVHTVLGGRGHSPLLPDPPYPIQPCPSVIDHTNILGDKTVVHTFTLTIFFDEFEIDLHPTRGVEKIYKYD